MKKFLMIVLMAGLMAACGQDQALPDYPYEDCEGGNGSEREPPGGGVASKERGITIR